MNILSLLRKLYSQFTSWLQVRPDKPTPEVYTKKLELYLQEFNIKDTEIATDPEILLENIANQLEFTCYTKGISSLPKNLSWRGIAESLCSEMNPDLTDLVTLSFVYSKLASEPFCELSTRALEIITRTF